MNVSAVSVSDLTDDQVAQWRSLQAATSACAGPHFCVDFVQAVAEVRAGIEVGVVTKAGRPCAFIPYRRAKGDVGQLIADNFSDFQGCVFSPHDNWSAAEMVRGCGLRALRFSHAPVSCLPLEPFVWQSKQASYIDLSKGFEAYRAARRKAGSDEIQEALRKARKIQRDVGPLDFELNSTDPAVFHTMIAWKRAQLKARELGDSFAGPWILPLLQRIVTTRADGFQGLMSVLRVNDTILAINLGMRSRDVFHGWVTTYNRDFARYSPGLMMVTQLAQAVANEGIRRIEMGCGGESFKRSLASGTETYTSGMIDLRPVTRIATQGWMLAKEMVRGTPLDSVARAAFRRMRHVRETMAGPQPASEEIQREPVPCQKPAT